ncbi:MAG: hypothetical protein WCA45_01945 [Thiobacillaceae bacterium]
MLFQARASLWKIWRLCPLGRQIPAPGHLHAIYRLKLARFKETFPAPAETDAIDARGMLQLIQMRWSYSTIPTLVATVSTVVTLMVTPISSMIAIFTAILISPITIVMASVRVNIATTQSNHHQACD